MDHEQSADNESAPVPNDRATAQSQATVIVGDVIIDPGNPFDFEEAELAELIEQLQAVEPGAEFAAHFREETEYGGAFTEVLHVWTSVDDFVNQNWQTIALIAMVVRWLRERWKRDRAADPKRPRPRSARVYDREQRQAFEIFIDLPHGEPVARPIDNPRHSHNRPAGARRKGSEIYDREQLDG